MAAVIGPDSLTDSARCTPRGQTDADSLVASSAARVATGSSSTRRPMRTHGRRPSAIRRWISRTDSDVARLASASDQRARSDRGTGLDFRRAEGTVETFGIAKLRLSYDGRLTRVRIHHVSSLRSVALFRFPQLTAVLLNCHRAETRCLRKSWKDNRLRVIEKFFRTTSAWLILLRGYSLGFAVTR